GINNAPFETQNKTVSAASNNTSLIPNPTVNYTSPNTTGSLTYTPLANANGAATITVTVTDDGGTANSGVDTTVRTFVVTVQSGNLPPTLDFINNLTLPISAPSQTVNLTGISDGDSSVTQNLTVSVASSNTAIIPTPTLSYTPNN